MSNMTRTLRRAALIAVSAVALSACGSILGPSEEEELFTLMASNVTENSSVLGLLKEPRWAREGAQPVRTRTNSLKDPPDRPVPDELAGEDGAFRMQPLAVVDHVFLSGPSCG